MFVCRVLIGMPAAFGRPSGSTSSAGPPEPGRRPQVGRGEIEPAQAEMAVAAVAQEAGHPAGSGRRPRKDVDRLAVAPQVGGAPAEPDQGLGIVRSGLGLGPRLGELRLAVRLHLGRQLRRDERLAQQGDGLDLAGRRRLQDGRRGRGRQWPGACAEEGEGGDEARQAEAAHGAGSV